MTIDLALAIDLQSQGKLDEAEKIYLTFLENNPKQPDVSNLLGSIYLRKQNFPLAQMYFEYATEGFPCAEYYQNLGLAHYGQNQYNLAMSYFSKAIDYEPNDADFIRNIAELARKANQNDYAINFYQKYLKLNPKDTSSWNNLGLLFKQCHDLNKEKECYITSLKIKENYEALHNLGVLRRMERNIPESIKCFKQALKLKPDSAITLFSLGMSYLTLKQFEEGYKLYMTKKADVKSQYHNHWDGQEHKDKTIMVYYDAGFGDQLMFCRYFKLLKNKFSKIKFYCSSQLRTLMKKNYPYVEIAESKFEDYDYCDNIMYLNYHLGLDFDNIPFAKGYLDAEKSDDEIFKTEKKKIGLFWQGSYDGYDNRAMPLKELAPLLEAQNCQFYGFVKEDKNNQIKEYPEIIDIGATLGDFYDTATKFKNLDLFITIDTAAANLAGAMGIKTFLLLPYASEWRWFDDNKTTPWYESVTIFKQETPWVWTDVIEKVLKEISN